jgi:hypothetical protein
MQNNKTLDLDSMEETERKEFAQFFRLHCLSNGNNIFAKKEVDGGKAVTYGDIWGYTDGEGDAVIEINGRPVLVSDVILFVWPEKIPDTKAYTESKECICNEFAEGEFIKDDFTHNHGIGILPLCKEIH